MRHKVAITALHAISPLGHNKEQILEQYRNPDHAIVNYNNKGVKALVAPLSPSAKEEIKSLRNSNQKYQTLDDTVLYAIYCARKAVKAANWENEAHFGVNIGSSRGATQLFEQYHESFLNKGVSETLSSPTTTLGNISSWVAHDLKSKGPEISHSITCATALHSVLNGCAWIQSGLTDKFLVGGSEAALTPFTIAQMQALKVYARTTSIANYPCKALSNEKDENTMILGEGAAMMCLEQSTNRALAYIEGIGYATEVLTHNVSISTEAICFQESMKMALGDIDSNEVDVVVTHTPGTIKGDIAEMNAIEKVFSTHMPAITTNKWKIGHTFGASGILSLEMAILMIQHQEFFKVPYLDTAKEPKKIERIIVNAVGFGGNAVSILLSRA